MGEKTDSQPEPTRPMPINPTKWLPFRLYEYWLENIKLVKDWHENGLLICAVSLGIVSFACWLSHLDNPWSASIRTLSKTAAIMLAAVWCLVWLPFRRHETTKDKCQKEVMRLNAECSQIKRQLEANVKSRQIKDKLGEFIRALEDRTNKIGAMSLHNYEGTLIEFEGSPFDKNSQDLIVTTYQFIKTNIGLVEAELFNSVTELSTNDNLDRQIDLATPVVEKKRTYMIARLQLHVRQLKSVIQWQTTVLRSVNFGG
jgi:hypothetical protein